MINNIKIVTYSWVANGNKSDINFITDNDSLEFEVEKDWLENKISQEVTEEWLDNYTHEDGYNLYQQALLENEIISQKIIK